MYLMTNNRPVGNRRNIYIYYIYIYTDFIQISPLWLQQEHNHIIERNTEDAPDQSIRQKKHQIEDSIQYSLLHPS